MFKAIAYNKFSNKIDLWEQDEDSNRTQHKEFYPELEYYIEDKTKKSKITDIYGNPVIKKIASSLDEIKSFKSAGVKMCESDINIPTKVLHQLYDNKELKADISKINYCIIDIEVEIGEDGSYSKAEDATNTINLITMYFSQSNRLVTLGLNEYTGNDPLVKEYHWIHSEKMLLEKAIEIFRKERAQIITGWNCKFYDLLYIVKRSEILGIEKNFSPLNRYFIKTKKENNDILYEVKFEGIAILDYMELYKKFTYTQRDSYSLQNIGMIEVGEGKVNYEGTINDFSKTDWNGFVVYNVQDVLLVKKFECGNPDAKDLKKRAGLKLIELAVILSYEALIPFDEVFSSMAVITGCFLKFLHKKNMVLPDRSFTEREKIPGAYVMCNPGFHKSLISFDFESLYPTIIRQWNISIETLVKDPPKHEIKNLYKTPLSEYKTWELESGEKITIGGIYFKKQEGILPKIVTKFFNDRKYFKNKMFEARDAGNRDLEEFYKKKQLVFKILINSMYGTTANQYFHLFSNECASCITLTGQHIIKYVSDNTNEYFKNYYLQDKNITLEKDMRAILDTDSTYFSFEELIEKLGLKFENDDEFLEWAKDLDTNFMKDFFKEILDIYAEQFGVKNIMNFKREKIITDMIVLAKKKYVTKVKDKEGETYIDPKFDITGVEIVRSSTPQFCRNKLLDVVKTIINTRDKEIVLKELAKIKKNFKSEDIKNIAFPRGVKEYTKYAKDVSYYLKNDLTYEKSTPIHVRAAMNYNYMIAKHKLKLMPITNGTKLKFIFINENNCINQNVIGFINEWPKDFDKFFKIDYEEQFEKSFLSVIERFFEVLDWGKINLKVSKMNKFFED